MAQAEDYMAALDELEFTSNPSVANLASDPASSLPVDIRIKQPGPSRATNTEHLGTQLEKAAACEESALRLATILERLEDSLQSVKLALNASVAIEELLKEAARLLERGREQSNPLSRETLGFAYGELVKQIDRIAGDAEYGGRNYATGDAFEVALDSAGKNILKLEEFTLTSASMGLTQLKRSFAADTEIIREMMRVDEALGTVRMRKTLMEMAISVLTSRARFSKNKVYSLHGASEALTQDGRARVAIQEIATRRLAASLAQEAALGAARLTSVRNDNRAPSSSAESSVARQDESRMESSADHAPSAAGEEPEDEGAKPVVGEIQTLIDDLGIKQQSQDLNVLAMDLARVLDEGSYLNQWLKFENGQTDIFIDHLAKSYGAEIIGKVKDKYKEDKKFKSTVGKFMRAYEKNLETKISNDPGQNPKPKIDDFLKTKYGTVYIILARATELV